MPDQRRRQFITLLGGAAAWPLAARAQEAGSTARIGLLWPGDAPPVSPRMESFRQGLRALGFVDGQNIAIELRYAQGGPKQLPELAAELVRLKVDVIYTAGDLAPKVAQQATETIPIVTISDDILGAGVVAGHCPLGPDYRRVAGDDDIERGSVFEFKAASPGSATSRGRRRGGPCGTQLAGRGAQRFLFADSRVTASGDHRLRGGIPSSGNLSVEGTRRGRGTGILWARSCGYMAA